MLTKYFAYQCCDFAPHIKKSQDLRTPQLNFLPPNFQTMEITEIKSPRRILAIGAPDAGVLNLLKGTSPRPHPNHPLIIVLQT